ncbi:hypothetical protein C8R43DRAFT_981008 [Mycena crocata]|nr:hypothetical protein C8R43DRAFT_981008 [Mycena crocata]
MASIRLRALSGASLLIVPTPTGTSFHVENSGNMDDSQEVLDIVLSSGSEGIRVSVVTHTVSEDKGIPPAVLSYNESRAPWSLNDLESLDFTGVAQEETQGMFHPLPSNELFAPMFSTSSSNFHMGAFEDPNLNPDAFGSIWPDTTQDVLIAAQDSPAPSSVSTGSVSVADGDESDYPNSPAISVGGSNMSTSVVARTLLRCRIPGCNRLCSREHTRRKHEEAHASKTPLSCSEPGCTTTFSRPHDKLRHEVRKHGHPCHMCNICNNFFSHAKGLEKHKCRTARNRSSRRPT